MDGEDLKNLKDFASYQDRYRFLGCEVLVRTDSPDIRRDFKRMHRPFWLEEEGEPEALECFFLSEKNLHRRPLILFLDRIYYIQQPTFIYEAFFFTLGLIVREIRSHFVFHGAVVAQGDKGLILSAPSGGGKSTLCMALCRQGFEFLSDELCAIDRRTLKISPFPRFVGLRDDFQRILPFLSPEAGHCRSSAGGEVKWILPPDSVGRIYQGDSCRPDTIVFLDPPAGKEGKVSEGSPILSRLSASEGLLRLSEALLNPSALKSQSQVHSDPRRAVFEMIDLLQGVRFFKIIRGDLKEMIRLTRDIMI